LFGFVTVVTAAAVVFSGTQPQMAATRDRVYLTFGKGDGISVARSMDGGRTFDSPSALPVAGKLALGMRRGPRIAATGSAVLVTAVIGARGGGADGDVLLYRSTDDGATWASPVVINDVAGSAREGMHAMAASPSGLVVIVWLDLRQKGTRVYAAVSRDHGSTWAPDALVYASPSGSVCECCHPSVATDEEGRVAIMFRNHVDGHRDMFVARSADGRTFTPATKLGTGSWALSACPMDGGSLAFGPDGVVSAWRREDRVFLSTATTPEQRLGIGRDPVLARHGVHQDLAWSTLDGVQLVRDGGAPTSPGRGRFPSLVALANQTLIAWEHEGHVVVQSIAR
jgi:hypothetical protein